MRGPASGPRFLTKDGLRTVAPTVFFIRVYFKLATTTSDGLRL